MRITERTDVKEVLKITKNSLILLNAVNSEDAITVSEKNDEETNFSSRDKNKKKYWLNKVCNRRVSEKTAVQSEGIKQLKKTK